MRYRLRTLLIVLALGPPLIAAAVWSASKAIEQYRESQRQAPILRMIIPIVDPADFEHPPDEQ